MTLALQWIACGAAWYVLCAFLIYGGFKLGHFYVVDTPPEDVRFYQVLGSALWPVTLYAALRDSWRKLSP